jgi:ABC-2 type transport system permease protein
MQVIASSIRAQLQMTRRNIEDLLPLITMPLFTLVFLAVFVQAGRKDFNGYAVVAPLLITLAQMGIFVASEMITRERSGQTLELLVASPAPFFMVVASRIMLLTSLGILGFAESWLLARVFFDVSVTVWHPWLLIVTLAATVVASTGTALVFAALICFARSTRAFQNGVAYPLFLLSGVLVPVNYLPDWLEPISRALFLYWSANLLRDAMSPGSPEDVALRLGVLLLLGLAGGVIGGVLIGRMLIYLKREGRLGLV